MNSWYIAAIKANTLMKKSVLNVANVSADIISDTMRHNLNYLHTFTMPSLNVYRHFPDFSMNCMGGGLKSQQKRFQFSYKMN